MDIVYRTRSEADAQRLLGKLVAAGAHPVCEQQERVGRRLGHHIEWVVWIPEGERTLAGPVARAWQLEQEAGVRGHGREFIRQVVTGTVLGALISVVWWVIASEYFCEQWGSAITMSVVSGCAIAIWWHERRRRRDVDPVLSPPANKRHK